MKSLRSKYAIIKVIFSAKKFVVIVTEYKTIPIVDTDSIFVLSGNEMRPSEAKELVSKGLNLLVYTDSLRVQSASEVKPPEDKKCPRCGSPMKLRTRKRDKVKFWGCSQFTNKQNSCSYSENC